MTIQKLTVQDTITYLKQSIALGKTHYLVLFIGSLIIASLDAAFNSFSFGIVLSSLFLFLWEPGRIYVSQIIAGERKDPVLGQFFVTFYKSTVLKRIVPCMVLTLVLTVVMLTIAGVALSFLTAAVLGGFQLSQSSKVATAVGMSVLTSLVGVLFLYFPYVLLLQTKDWKESFKISLKGAQENFLITFICMFIVTIPGLLFMIYTMTSSFEQVASSSITTGINFFQTVFLGPFVMTFKYLLYKHIFLEEEVRIADLP